jgi:transposase
MPRARRTFTREFKVQAVKLVTEQGYSFAEAARQLGVRDHQIRTWKKQLDAEAGGAASADGSPHALDAELRRLRAENKRLQMEHDILKKAAAFFAKECT